MIYRIGALLLFTLLMAGCNDKSEDQAEEDRKIIEHYIMENNLDAEEKEDGLFIVHVNEGVGASPSLDDNVKLFYKGYLTTGEVFDETKTDTADFPLGSLIDGWQVGLPYMKEGGSSILLIPSALGYGSRDVGDIPKNSVLVFEIDLIEVH
jgi:FKBP-type peptidyl-prolyl cis-trans isomerase FkpA